MAHPKSIVQRRDCFTPTWPNSWYGIRNMPQDPPSQTPFSGLIAHRTLANVSNAMIRATLNNQLWNPVVRPSGTFVPELASTTHIASGNFEHIPIVGGSNLNDGSIFGTTLRNLNLTSNAEDDVFDGFVLDPLIDSTRVAASTLTQLCDLANDTSGGTPFNTGRRGQAPRIDFVTASAVIALPIAVRLKNSYAQSYKDAWSGRLRKKSRWG